MNFINIRYGHNWFPEYVFEKYKKSVFLSMHALTYRGRVKHIINQAIIGSDNVACLAPNRYHYLI